MPVDWYEREVLLKIAGATDEALTALAFHGEALAKVNIQANGQIDTGFMLNSTYGLGPTGSHRAEAEAEAAAVAERQMAGPPSLEEDQAAIHAAAEYAIYQELANSFLYRAVEQLQEEAGGIIEDVARRKGL